MAHILLRHRDIPNLHKLSVYQAHDGYAAWQKVLTEYEPQQVINVVRDSNLRGRGGAGFPTGVKWGFIPKAPGDKYIVINTDESETGTFKDRELVASGSSVVAVDSVGAGVGECVMFTQGSSARLTPTTKDAPVDCVIVGIVDTVEVGGQQVEKP